MVFKEVPLSEINFEDETFRITEDLCLEPMVASLQAVGQIHPVILAERRDSGPCRIVCGFRRLRALRSMGRAAAAAGFPAGRGPDELALFLLALWDKAAQRPFAPLEAARTLSTLKQACGQSDEVLIERFLPLLGLPPHRNVLQAFLNLHMLHPELRRLMKDGHLTLSSAERLADASLAEQGMMAPVLCKIRLSASLQREVLELCDDLAAIHGTTAAGILNADEILAIAGDPDLSPYQKGERIRRHLARRRNPRLTRAQDAFFAEKKDLNLPGHVRLSPDPYFESPQLEVSFKVASAQAFRETAEALGRAAQTPALEKLFEVR